MRFESGLLASAGRNAAHEVARRVTATKRIGSDTRGQAKGENIVHTEVSARRIIQIIGGAVA